MKRLLILLMLCASPLFASDANFVWVPGGPTVADTWSIYIGTTSGTYTPVATGLPTMSYSFPDGSMTPNVRNYVAVTGSNAAGESGFSVEVHGFPRAIITSAVPVQDVGFIRLTITGSNFSDGIATADIVFPGMTVLNVNRVSANQVFVDYTVDPGTPPVSADLTITNKWGDGAGLVVSVISQVFPVPSLVPPPPVVESIN